MERPPRVEHPSAPGSVAVEAASTELVADGRSATTLTLQVRDGDGQPVQDGTRVRLYASLGRIEAISATSGGVATARLVAGTWPGAVELWSATQRVEAPEIAFVRAPAYAAQLHLHGSFSEGEGTMLGHTLQAEATGIDVLWWTDHDHYYLQDRMLETTGYDFESGAFEQSIPSWPAGNTLMMRWEETRDSTDSSVVSVSDEAAYTGVYGLRMGLLPDHDGTRAIELRMHPALNTHPLLAGVDFGFAIRPRREANENVELRVGLELSTPPIGTEGEGSINRIIFYHSTQEHADTANTRWVPIDAPAGQWTELSWDLTALAEEAFPGLGADQKVTFASLTISGGIDGGTWDIDDLWWTQRSTGAELLELQRAYLDSLPHAPTHHVGHEIGLIKEATHINAYGREVPLPQLAQWEDVDWQRAVDAVHAAGGITSYNHMFGWNVLTESEEERAELVANRTAELLGNEAWGCDLLEVGYRMREGLLQDFLFVWDQLSMAGLFITGVGVSDLHIELRWNSFVNNFVTWIPSASDSEDDLAYNLRRGNAYFGNPARFEGAEVALSYTAPDSRATMGQVVVDAYGPQRLHLQVDPLQPGWEVRLVVNSVTERRWTVGQEGPSSFIGVIDPRGGQVARFEVWDGKGEAILLTNPIWFLDEMPVGGVGDRLPSP